MQKTVFKIGDVVKVIDSSYPITGKGSYGRIRRIHIDSRSLNIVFIKIVQSTVDKEGQMNWNVNVESVELFKAYNTSLGKILYKER